MLLLKLFTIRQFRTIASYPAAATFPLDALPGTPCVPRAVLRIIVLASI
jgi:hypothetical protein